MSPHGVFHILARSDPESRAQVPASFIPHRIRTRNSSSCFRRREAPDPQGDGSQGPCMCWDQLPPSPSAPRALGSICSPEQNKCVLPLGSSADCRMAGEVPVPHPLPGWGAEKSSAAKALAAAQCGLSPSLMDAAVGEEGLVISPRAMGRWGTSYSLILSHEEPAPPQQKSRGGLKLASTRPAQTIFIFKPSPGCALLSREGAHERTDPV